MRCAVARHLVLLDPLRDSDQCGIDCNRIAGCGDDVVAVLEEAVHGVARFRRGESYFHVGERLLKPFYMGARLLQVRLEGLPKFVRIRRRCHLRQRLDELLLGAVQIPKFIDEHIRQRVEFHFSPL